MDIAQRLRDWQDYEPVKMFAAEMLPDLEEAAAEIERLRGALRQIELNTRTGDPKTLKLNWLARTALAVVAANGEEMPAGSAGTTIINDGRPT